MSESIRHEALPSTDRIVVAKRFWRVVSHEAAARPAAEMSVYLKEGTLRRHDPHATARLIAELFRQMWDVPGRETRSQT